MPPLVSLVVPILNDSDAADALLRQVSADARTEITLVDGDYDERLGGLAGARPDVRLIRTAAGRGRQMNAGAAAATGTWLLFLHGDSILPRGWLDAFATMPLSVAGGWFRFALDDAAWQARVIELGVRWRVHLLSLPYGDQGLFIRRDLFERLRGYRDLPLMEDVDMVRRLRHAGPMVEIPLPLTTSARRWRRGGWFRRSARNIVLVLLYFAGVSPARLARWYR
jgi:rSAM/selenodomain-associated transferase 2